MWPDLVFLLRTEFILSFFAMVRGGRQEPFPLMWGRKEGESALGTNITPSSFFYFSDIPSLLPTIKCSFRTGKRKETCFSRKKEKEKVQWNLDNTSRAFLLVSRKSNVKNSTVYWDTTVCMYVRSNSSILIGMKTMSLSEIRRDCTVLPNVRFEGCFFCFPAAPPPPPPPDGTICSLKKKCASSFGFVP